MVVLNDIDPALHASLLHQWRLRPDIARFMYTQRPIAWSDHHSWLESLATDQSRRHWVIEFNGRPVGTTYFTEIDRLNQRAIFGMYVADDGARLLGVGAAAEWLSLNEAFGALDLQKVSCEIFASNEAPLRMHIRMGFKLEGLLRRHARFDNGWVDVHRVSLLREEWHAARPALRNALHKLLPEPVLTL